MPFNRLPPRISVVASANTFLVNLGTLHAAAFSSFCSESFQFTFLESSRFRKCFMMATGTQTEERYFTHKLVIQI